MDGGWLGVVVFGAWAWVLKTQAAAHKQITLVKRLITLKQIGDWSSYQPFQPSEKETDPGQPRLTQPSLSPGSCKRKIRRWTDPGPCPTRGRVKRPLPFLLTSPSLFARAGVTLLVKEAKTVSYDQLRHMKVGRELKQRRRQRHRQCQKTMIWLVE